METFTLLGLNLAAWITIATVLALFLSLLFTSLREDIAFLGAVAILFMTGVLTEKEAFAGFSSSSVVVVGVLFIVVAGLTHTGVLRWIMQQFLGTPKNYPAAIVRLMTTVAALSAVLSNTTVVALFVQIVKKWASKLGTVPSKLLIPLSYASGLGGICTIIGTPPNLLISGMYAQDSGVSMGFFSTTIPGLACLAVGILSILAMRRLLPERKSPEDAFDQTADYTVELLVPADHPRIGQSLSESGLLDAGKAKLIELVRFDREIVSPVSPDEVLMGGDRLIYAGDIEDILTLRAFEGLVNADHPVFHVDELDRRRTLRTAYVQPGCELLGKPVSQTTFERDHRLTLIAVARQGERIDQSPRDVKLRVGDSLLLECVPGSANQEIKGMHFMDPNGSIPDFGYKTLISMLIMLGMVLLSSLKVMSLVQSAIIAAAAMLVFRCCTPTQAAKSVDWNILMVFAGSVVIGNAIEKTGLATVMANGLMDICNNKPLLVMTMMCVTATFITEFISNTAAGAIFYPIVYQSAIAMGCNPMPFLISLMIAVSSSFATPIGSPTHLLVYGPGGYRFSDFMKVGIPMNIIILAANLLVVNLIYPL
jgi:di/tricarboxylate transporter